MSWLAAAWLALLVLVCPQPAEAHVRSVSWSAWTIAGAELDGRVRLSLLDLSAIQELSPLGDAALDVWLRAHLRLDPSCVVDPSQAELADPGFVVRRLHARCAEGAPFRVESDLFLEAIPSHLHFVTVSREGAAPAEHLLSRDHPAWELPREGSEMGLSAMVRLGVTHILSGADHLVFLLALILAASSFRRLAVIVTGFTLGHSAALGLAVLGGVRPDSSAIEALVGVTIALVAVENVWLARRDPWLPRAVVIALVLACAASLGRGAIAPSVTLGMALFAACYFGLIARSPRHAEIRGLVTALFGLVHGFAFSSVLVEMALPRARLAASLFGFNLGVELGQLAIVAPAWLLWRRMARTSARAPALELASAGALAAGVFWFVSRGFG